MEIKNKIYISGPITGLDYEKAKATFDAAERRITKNGFIAVNPMNLLPNGLPYKSYMMTDIIALIQCDAIFMLEGYENSEGAKLELHIAESLDMHVIYESELKDLTFVTMKGKIRKGKIEDFEDKPVIEVEDAFVAVPNGNQKDGAK